MEKIEATITAQRAMPNGRSAGEGVIESAMVEHLIAVALQSDLNTFVTYWPRGSALSSQWTIRSM
jgi:hypothetical protein